MPIESGTEVCEYHSRSNDPDKLLFDNAASLAREKSIGI